MSQPLQNLACKTYALNHFMKWLSRGFPAGMRCAEEWGKVQPDGTRWLVDTFVVQPRLSVDDEKSSRISRPK